MSSKICNYFIFIIITIISSVQLHKTKQIHIPGFKPINCNGEKIFECRHVPYAKYPFRFEPAEKLESHKNVSFPHYLTMDIFTKNPSSNKSVIVGLLQENFGEFDFVKIPKFMLKRVVFVSVNYRRNLYGFLSTNSTEIPGNAALGDIILALEWIQEYIPYFGGDNERITLMGLEDSGAIVHALSLSPKVPKGFFHQIIIGDTSFFTPRLTTGDPIPYAIKIAEESGCKTPSTFSELNQCLLSPTNNLDSITRRCSFKEKKRTMASPLKLCIVDSSDFFPDYPKYLALESERPYPALIGSSFYVLKDYIQTMIDDDDYANFIPTIDKIFEDAVRLIRKFADESTIDGWITYYSEKLLNVSQSLPHRTIHKVFLQDLLSTIDSKYPLLNAALHNSKDIGAPTFLYAFDNDFFTLNSNQLGFMDLESYDTRSEEAKSFRALIDIWTHFAENGEPPNAMPSIYYEWPGVSHSFGPYLKLRRHSSINDDFQDEFDLQRMQHGDVYD